MNRQGIIQLAESLGLLYPEPKSSSDYNHPAHMRLISKLEKFYAEAHTKGWYDGIDEVDRQREKLKDFEEKGKSSSDFQSD